MSLVKSVGEVQAFVKQTSRVVLRSGGTKTALSTPTRSQEVLELGGLSGIVEYIPEEFTFTALAGTRFSEVNRILSGHNQYLPFDPPFVERGATLGGTVAAGLSGSGRYRYGGVRDFLLGVRFVDGRGEEIRGGGKVVKNVAGYDFPKLLVGSRGGLGVIVELSFKVFPKPESFVTIKVPQGDLGGALRVLKSAAESGIALEALDLECGTNGFTVWARLGGLASALRQRTARLVQSFDQCQVLQGPDEEQIWRLVSEMTWVPASHTLIKIPMNPGLIPAFEAALRGKLILRRYVAGGHLAWLAVEESLEDLAPILSGLGLSGLTILGAPGFPVTGKVNGDTFLRRVKDVLDPARHFIEL